MRSVKLCSVVSVFVCGLALAQDVPKAPLNPFAPPDTKRTDARYGIVEISDGTVHKGKVLLTRDRMFRIFDRAAEVYRDFPIAAVRDIEVSIEKAQIEKEWRWKEGGSDVKVYTGRSYPWRKYLTTVTLRNGRKFTGDMMTLFYVETDDGTKKLMFHKRDKGPMGSTLAKLTYVKKVTFPEKTKGSTAEGAKNAEDDKQTTKP